MRLKDRKINEPQCLHLAELKAMFDAAIRKGNSFRDVKRIYVRMKHLKRYLKSINVE